MGAERQPAGSSVSIIGPGRAGMALGRALESAGHPVRSFHARSPAGRDRAAAFFPAAVAGATPAEAAALADVILLAVPDDRIEEVAARIARGVARVPAPLVAHLSGRHGIGPLGPVAAVGAHPVALHPIMTLTGGPGDAGRLAGTTFGVTTAPGDSAAEEAARGLVADLGGRVAIIPEEMRVIYHASLVLGGNFLATLATAAGRLAATAGVPDPAGALGPLLRASLENALAHGEHAMTGPVRRGDVGTVRAQSAELSRLDADLADVYATLAVLTADSLQSAGLLAPDVAAALRSAVARR